MLERRALLAHLVIVKEASAEVQFSSRGGINVDKAVDVVSVPAAFFAPPPATTFLNQLVGSDPDAILNANYLSTLGTLDYGLELDQTTNYSADVGSGAVSDQLSTSRDVTLEIVADPGDVAGAAGEGQPHFYGRLHGRRRD